MIIPVVIPVVVPVVVPVVIARYNILLSSWIDFENGFGFDHFLNVLFLGELTTITRSQTHKTIITQIEIILASYFSEIKVKDKGLPTVKFLADSVNLSPSYLSDLLKKETGKNAQEHIHFYLIEEAKNLLLNSDKNINEIAYGLGFEYPQYFNKLFKKKTGKTPMEYRNWN